MHRQSRTFASGLICGLGLFCLAGQGRASVPNQQAEQRPSLSEAPDAAGSWPNPYEGRLDAALAGAKLFRHHCVDCHGAEAAGSDRAPNLRMPAVTAAAPGVLFWFLTNGNLKQGMPSWSGLPDERRWQLVTYIRSLAPLH